MAGAQLAELIVGEPGTFELQRGAVVVQERDEHRALFADLRRFDSVVDSHAAIMPAPTDSPE
jgi:hypothetical protein